MLVKNTMMHRSYTHVIVAYNTILCNICSFKGVIMALGSKNHHFIIGINVVMRAGLKLRQPECSFGRENWVQVFMLQRKPEVNMTNIAVKAQPVVFSFIIFFYGYVFK